MRTEFLLTIDTGGDAFALGELEIARLLREAADQLMDGASSGVLRDTNGNTAGSWEFV